MTGRWAPLVVLPLAAVLLHLACIGNYGYFRDELYYLACAKRLSWGYVDHPPFCVAVLRVVVSLLGDSLAAIRTPMLLASGLAVLLVQLLARRMGAANWAVWLAGLCALLSGMYLVICSMYSMNAFEIVFWTATALALPWCVEGRSLWRWALLGVLLGACFLNKASALWLVSGLGLGLIASPLRKELLRPGPWLALAVMGLVAAPHLAWQVANGWPTAEFARNARELKMLPIPAWAFFAQQVVVMNVVAAPVIAAGVIGGVAALVRQLRAEKVVARPERVLMGEPAMEAARPLVAASAPYPGQAGRTALLPERDLLHESGQAAQRPDEWTESALNGKAGWPGIRWEGREADKYWPVFAVAFLWVVAILLVGGRSRVNYLAPAYPLVIAPGAVAVERWAARQRIRPAWVYAAFGVSAPFYLTFGLPWLSPPAFTRLATAMPVQPPTEEAGPKSPMQGWADMFGWPEMAGAVRTALASLPAGERQRAAVVTYNYGEAAALEHFGVPRVLSGHNNYWLWGFGDWDGSVAVFLHEWPPETKAMFREFRRVGRVQASYAVPEEADSPVWIARGLKVPKAVFWMRVKRYY